MFADSVTTPLPTGQWATGIAGGFQRPASSAFEAQVIPITHIAKGTSWASSIS